MAKLATLERKAVLRSKLEDQGHQEVLQSRNAESRSASLRRLSSEGHRIFRPRRPASRSFERERQALSTVSHSS
jgi:hypothetical protein